MSQSRSQAFPGSNDGEVVKLLLTSPGEQLPALVSGERAHAAGAVASATARALADTGRGLNLSDAELAGLDLTNLDLRGATLSRARLDRADLSGTDLRGSTLICPLMERAAFREARLDGVRAHALAAVSADWSGVHMPGAIDTTGSLFHGVNMTRSVLSGGNYAGATFYQCDLTGADLSGCNLTGTTFNECVLRDTKLTGATLTSGTVTRSSMDGADLRRARGAGLTLQQITAMSDVQLDGAYLPELSVRSATVRRLRAQGAVFTGGRFSDLAADACDFHGSDLSETLLRTVRGRENRFSCCVLVGASVVRCSLPGCDFRGADMENARLLECQLPESRFTQYTDDKGSAVGFVGRALVVRDCDLGSAQFAHAYLYRASFTGDPVTGMRLDQVDMAGANLIQAYVAAAMPGAVLKGAHAAYSRFNQSDLRAADLKGATLFEASFVKTSLADADLTAVRAPLFVDRCPGLASARMDDGLRRWTDRLADIMAHERIAST
jgi:uncharacterized protein YjbI with pentapeptide repeats